MLGYAASNSSTIENNESESGRKEAAAAKL
jgi:hypothetical protein